MVKLGLLEKRKNNLKLILQEMVNQHEIIDLSEEDEKRMENSDDSSHLYSSVSLESITPLGSNCHVADPPKKRAKLSREQIANIYQKRIFGISDVPVIFEQKTEQRVGIDFERTQAIRNQLADVFPSYFHSMF